MVKGVCLGKEIMVTVVNKIGVLADMSKVLADQGINIEAVAGYGTEGSKAEIILVTEDNQRAGDALKNKGYKSIEEREVVIMDLENRAGALKDITEKLAAQQLDIKYIYGTTCSAGCPAKIILSTVDNKKALVALEKK